MTSVSNSAVLQHGEVFYGLSLTIFFLSWQTVRVSQQHHLRISSAQKMANNVAGRMEPRTRTRACESIPKKTWGQKAWRRLAAMSWRAHVTPYRVSLSTSPWHVIPRHERSRSIASSKITRVYMYVTSVQELTGPRVMCIIISAKNQAQNSLRIMGRMIWSAFWIVEIRWWPPVTWISDIHVVCLLRTLLQKRAMFQPKVTICTWTAVQKRWIRCGLRRMKSGCRQLWRGGSCTIVTVTQILLSRQYRHCDVTVVIHRS